MAVYSQVSKFDPNVDMTYTGSKTILDDGNGNWRIKFLTSGTLTFLKDPKGIDLFLAGGGGSGGQAGGGGGGGYTKNIFGITPVKNTGYSIVIGAGGAAVGAGSGLPGGASSAFGQSVSGGLGGVRSSDNYTRPGGAGGSGGGGYNRGLGGVDGANGGADMSAGGIGQHTTTREFGEATGTLYSEGGRSGGPTTGAANTARGGDGFATTGGYYGLAGGSGIVVIRNAA